jgi:hypothetical protein
MSVFNLSRLEGQTGELRSFPFDHRVSCAVTAARRSVCCTPVPNTVDADTAALINGASAGIGASTAILFAKTGCNLVLLARRQDKLDEVKAQAEAAYPAGKKGKVVVITVDMTNLSELDSVTSKLDGLKVDM